MTVVLPFFRQAAAAPLLRCLLLALTGLLSFAPAARATSVIPPTFTELVNQADYIVRAVVKSVNSEYAGPEQKMIITKVELDVREVIAGTPPKPLVLTMLGGKVGPKTITLTGAPQFAVGDEDILFVQGNGQQAFPLVAIMHGRYPIRREAGTGREFISRSNHVPLRSTAEVGLPVAESGATPLPAKAQSAATALTPEQFKAEIKAIRKPGPAQHLAN